MTSPVLEVRKLGKRYRTPAGTVLPVFEDVSFSIPARGIVALTGVSGAGKSTLLRCLCSLEQPDSGDIFFEGLPALRWKQCHIPSPIQLIFQDPGASLNPRFTAFEAVDEALRIRGVRDRHGIVSRLLNQTGLPDGCAPRKCWQFSGGQRARLAIARALAAEPRILLLDESLSGLDASVRAQIVNLLLDLQRWRDLSYLLVTHDRDLARALTPCVLELEYGRLKLADSAHPPSWLSEMAGVAR
jgi:ABC-type dipeptide/oligopeptide/nickel transport system ATPase subunit